MDQSLQRLSPDEVQSLPIDRLGILVLKQVARSYSGPTGITPRLFVIWY
jgi:hypothetical protein